MKNVITEALILTLVKQRRKTLVVNKTDIITPLALDAIKDNGISVEPKKSATEQPKISESVKDWKTIAIGGDHTGLAIKSIVTDILVKKGYDVIDCGTYTPESCDYPDFAIEVGKKIALKEVDSGILIDASGIPSGITANKFPGIRAATCYNEFSAKSARLHNNANIIALGAKTLGEETIKSIIEVWLNTEFEGGRHQRRLDKISQLEKHFLAKNV